MFYRYQRYVAWVIFRAIFITALVFITLLFLTRLGRDLGNLNDHYGLLDACFVALLDMPHMFNLFYAVIFFVGTVCGVAQLTSSNAIVILRASGVSALTIIGYILLLIMPILITFGMLSNSWAALAAHASSTYRSERIHNTTGQDISLPQVWSAENNTVFLLTQLKKDNTAKQMQVFHTEKGRLTGVQIVDQPQFDATADSWQLPVQHTYLASHNATSFAIADWQPQQPARLLWLQNAKISYLTLLDVYRLTQRDAKLGTKNSRYQHELYKRILAPLISAAMIVLGICLVLRASRSIPVEKQIGLALLLGLCIDYGSKLANNVTLVFALIPGSGSVLMIALCLGGAWWLIRSVRL